MRLIATSWLALAVLTLAACERAPDPRFAELTTAESASLKAIFEDIRTASRESFEREDWSALARLYPAGTLACWNTAGEQHRYGFLSIRFQQEVQGSFAQLRPVGQLRLALMAKHFCVCGMRTSRRCHPTRT